MYIITILSAFLVAIIVGAVFLPVARRLKYGQTIYELGPQSHLAKQGIPTMGGVIFMTASILALLPQFFTEHSGALPLLIVCSLLFSFIGFLDDYVKVVKKRSLGLTPAQKIILQVLFSVVTAVWLSKLTGTGLYIPFVNKTIDLGLFYVPFVALVLIAMSNSSNLLDGVDGLLTTNSIVIFAGYLCILFIGVFSNIITVGPQHIEAIALFLFASIGACIGFLRFNLYPARIIMGDTGSMYLGTSIGIIALLTNTALFLPLMAFTMMISSLSDIIQVYSYKTRKKRVFKMAPLHHHFELSGMSETKIVLMYMITQIIMCALVLYLIVVSVR